MTSYPEILCSVCFNHLRRDRPIGVRPVGAGREPVLAAEEAVEGGEVFEAAVEGDTGDE